MKKGRMLLVVGLILSLLATAVVQKLALSQRHAILKTSAGTSASTSLANMDSYALALLLGGMRGPLVMFLWMQSEAQKQDKDLEGVETQIEWIRLLQPEFDTVHLFQIWNKAYNISAQMASLANKYSVILDALEYASNVEKQRPDNINILMTQGNIFNDKFANSHEKFYYRDRVRKDSMYRPEKAARVAGARPTRMDSVLDPDGNVQAKYVTPRFGGEGKKGTYYDGSELQFLKDYQPFPYGVSPFALAYNFFRRTQILQNDSGQLALQTSPMVIDSRPALTLRAWVDEEWDHGIRAELRLLGIKPPTERFDAIRASGASNPMMLSAEQVQSRKADLEEGLYRYGLTLRLIDDAELQFREHLSKPDYQMHVSMYQSHLEHLKGSRAMVTADRLLFQAANTADAAKRTEMAFAAKQLYAQAVRQFRIVRLRYYINEQLHSSIMPVGVKRDTMELATDQQLATMISAVDRANAEQGYDMSEDDTREYMSYVNKGLARISQLGK